MTHQIRDAGVARQIGKYSDAIETAPGQRWLFTAGTPGLSSSGDLPPDIESQSELAWQNVMQLLKDADMSVGDIVKVSQYLTRAEDIQAYAQIRNRFLGDARPASMLTVVSQLVWPTMLVEVEVIAARS